MKNNIKVLFVLLVCAVLMFTASFNGFAVNEYLLRDDAQLLDSEDYNALLTKLDTLSNEMEFAFAIVTVNNVSDYGYSSDDDGDMAFADDYWDNHDMGYEDGTVLFIDIGTSYCYISTAGYAISAIGDDQIDYIIDEIWDYLRYGNYYSAFTTYATITSTLIDGYDSSYYYDNPYEDYDEDIDEEPEIDYGTKISNNSFDWLKIILAAIITGIIVAFVVTGRMKSKLKTVRAQKNASVYEVPGSLNITNSRDTFLYATVTSTPKPKDPPPKAGGSSGHSASVHTSGGGVSHGGGGRHF